MDMSATDLLTQLDEVPARPNPTMGVVAKMRYTHTDMIDYIISNPGISQNALAARYGYTAAWVSNIMASDAWQAAMASRRHEIVDPEIKATMEERFRGMTIQAIKRVQEELEKPVVNPSIALKAIELGAKSLGIGGNAPPSPPAADHLAQLANRLIDLQSNVRKGVVYENEAVQPG